SYALLVEIFIHLPIRFLRTERLPMSTKPHAARRVSSVLAAAALAGGILFTPASMTVLPQAQAQSCDETHRAVAAGSLNWGVKESFRNYVEGRIANGKITVTHDASRSGGSIKYPASASASTSNTARPTRS